MMLEYGARPERFEEVLGSESSVSSVAQPVKVDNDLYVRDYGNCIAVCPTGALMATPEFELRKAGEWRPESQAVTDTICPYCGVGCTLTVHVQDQQIVKVTSPFDNDVTRGNLCVKGRFGFEYVNRTPDR